MDRQNRVGSKPGSGGVLGGVGAEINQRERLKELAMQTIDLNKDPYFMRNHFGSFECKLCGTTHPTEGNYLHHTQCKRHQYYLAKRALRDKQESDSTLGIPSSKRVEVRKTIKIGRPGYKAFKKFDPKNNQKGLAFEIIFPDLKTGTQPRHRIMSAFEQNVGPKDPRYQYILFSGEPYEIIAFRIPNLPLDKNKERFTTNWNNETKMFALSLYFLTEK